MIDGSNFYFKLKQIKLKNQLNFNFSLFVNSLAGKNKIVSSTYYVGAVRTDGTAKTQQMFNNQRKLLAHLKKNSFRYSLGYLLKTHGKFHEKGVDVQIAVDILKGAYKNLYDIAYLVSSDSDLLPAILEAQLAGKTIVYVGFKHQTSFALLRQCKKSLLLSKKDLLKFTTNSPTS